MSLSQFLREGGLEDPIGGLPQADIIDHFTEGLIISSQDRVVVFVHTYPCQRYANNVSMERLGVFLESFHRVKSNRTLLGEIRDRVAPLQEYANVNFSKTIYLEQCVHGSDDSLFNSTWLNKTWYAGNFAERFWKELGEVGRRMSILEWEGWVKFEETGRAGK